MIQNGIASLMQQFLSFFAKQKQLTTAQFVVQMSILVISGCSAFFPQFSLHLSRCRIFLLIFDKKHFCCRHPHIRFSEILQLRKAAFSIARKRYSRPYGRHCGKEIIDEDPAPAGSLLCCVRIGYPPQSPRKPASECRRKVAHPRLLQPLSAALSAKIRFGP